MPTNVMHATKLSSGVFCIALAAAQWPDPIPSTGNLSYVHDPNVIFKDGIYYRFSTFGGIHIASAPDMTGPWEAIGEALEHGSTIPLPGNDSLWAPDVTLADGTYYMYYAVSKSGSQNSDIGVATSTGLTPGSWTDHGSIGIQKNKAYNKIDPNLFLGDDGTSPLLSFGSYWGDIFQVEMQSPPLHTTSGSIPMNIEYNSTLRAPRGPPEVMEGSFQFKATDGSGRAWYYLFWSSGECCNVPPKLAAQGDEYKIMVARSDALTGPWLDDRGRDSLQGGGKLVLGSHGDSVYAPGGQGVMIDPKTNSTILYYHYVNPTVGYGVYDFQFGFNYLNFTTGWPVVFGSAQTNMSSASTSTKPSTASSSSSPSSSNEANVEASGSSLPSSTSVSASASNTSKISNTATALACPSFYHLLVCLLVLIFFMI